MAISEPQVEVQMNFHRKSRVALAGTRVSAIVAPDARLDGQDLRSGPREVSRPTNGGPQAGQRHPLRTGPVEEGSEGRTGDDQRPPQRASRVRHDREGLRHAPGRPEVRPREDEPDPEPVPDLAVED